MRGVVFVVMFEPAGVSEFLATSNETDEVACLRFAFKCVTLIDNKNMFEDT